MVDRAPAPEEAPRQAAPTATPRAPEAPEVERNVDEFSGVETVTYQSGVEWEDGRTDPSRLLIVVAGGRVRLTIHGAHDEWRWLRCHSLHLLVDGERVPLGEPDHQGRAASRGVIESVAADAPNLLQALGEAQSMRARVCNDVFAVPEAFMPHVRHLAELSAFVDASEAEAPREPISAGEN